MESDVILKAENLYFSYEEEPDVFSLNGLDLEIRRGQRTAFLGSNGSGKSTFFLCCNGIHRPSAGTLYFDGQPLRYDRRSLLELRRRVGIVFQDPDQQLFSSTVDQDISFGPLNLGLPEEQVRREVEEIIEKMELTPFRNRPTHALSGGQKKQVSIADILVMHPEVVILDEPAAALDPRHTLLVDRLVDQLTDSGITVLMSTHDADRAFQWADQVIVLHRGRVLAEGRPEDVFRQKALLEQASLKQPAVLELYDCLVERGVFPAGQQPPKTLEQLKQLLLTALPCRADGPI